jgi:hypothetical protein
MFTKNSNELLLLLICIAAVLAVYTALITQVSYLDASDWGLLSRLPWSYWLGVGVVGTVILISLRSSRSLNMRLSFVILVMIIVYTNFLPAIIEKPIGLSGMSLWPSSQANLVIASGHIAVGHPTLLLDYTNWPFFTIFTSIFMLITGSPLSLILKWFPLFTVAFWGLMVFLILKKFMRPEYALIGVSVFICGSWTRQEYFGPQSIAMSLFLVFIYLITKTTDYGFGTRNKQFLLLAFVTFFAIVISHELTSFSLLLIMLTAYLIMNIFTKNTARKTKSNLVFCLLCGAVFLSYTVFVTPAFLRDRFGKVLSSLGTSPAQQFSRLPGSQFQQLTNASTYALVLAFASVSAISLLFMFRKKKLPTIQLAFWTGLICALFVVAFIPYGEEGPFRAFLYALPFLSLFCVYILKSKPLLLGCFLLVILVVNIPAVNGSDSYRLVTNPEMQGSNYCAEYLPSGSTVFGQIGTYVRYFDPLKDLQFISPGTAPFLSYNPSSIEAGLGKTNFIVVSRNQQNYYEYYVGRNPFEGIDLTGNISLSRACIYDDGNFTVYVTSP